MADRRRRKCSDLGSDESGDDAVLQDHSDASDGANSEYESVDEDELGDEEEVDLIIPGTGEESKPLDDDEDRKNPQYIPKRGTFYEHDDRTAEEAGEEKSPRDEQENEKSDPQDKKLPDPTKKVWKGEDSKWKHDRFVDFDQSPKTREELVATYGYDIRNEEGPPRARRRRRYGRGPNKYTRNWEDFDAYSRPSRGSGGVSPNSRGGGGERGRGRGKRNSLNSEEDFPSLIPNDSSSQERPIPKVNDDEVYVNNVPTVEITISDRPNQKTVYNNQINQDNNRGGKFNQSSPRQINEENSRREGPGRGRAPNRRGGRVGPRGGGGSFGQQQPRDNNGGQPHKNWNEHSRGGRFDNRGRGQNYGRAAGHSNNQIQSTVFHQQQKEVIDVTEELKTMTITPSNKEEIHFNNVRRGNDFRKNTLPPRLQDSMRGNKSPIHGDVNATSSKPKRYSSQRQRTLQDQVMYQQGYYEPNPNETGFQGNLYEVRNNSSPITSAHPVSINPNQLSTLRPVNAPPSFVAPTFTTSPSVYPSESFLGRPPAPRLAAIVTQPHLIGPGGPIATGPPNVAGPAMSGGSVAPVSGPHFLPSENMINFAAGAPPGLVAGPHPPQFPAAAFQAFTPVVSQQQPQEIYSNGTMYYNTQSQQYIPRINPVLQKRPKAAIPIVPPPDRQNKPREYEDDYEGNYENYRENSSEEYESRLDDNYSENYSEEYDSNLHETYKENECEEYEHGVNENYPENSNVQYESDKDYPDSSREDYESQLENNDVHNSSEDNELHLAENYSEKSNPADEDCTEDSMDLNCANESTESDVNNQSSEEKQISSCEEVQDVLIKPSEPTDLLSANLKEALNSDVLKPEISLKSEHLPSIDCPDSNQDEFIDASEEAHHEELCSKNLHDLPKENEVENLNLQESTGIDNTLVTNAKSSENLEHTNNNRENISEVNLEQISNTVALSESAIEVEKSLNDNTVEEIKSSSITDSVTNTLDSSPTIELSTDANCTT